MSKHSFDKLEQMAGQAINDLLKSLIYEDDGTYVMYERYYISKRGQEFEVYRRTDEVRKTFSRLRNAAAWCTLDFYNKFYEANRIIYLDQKMESLEIDKALHAKRKKSGDLESRGIALVKYQHDIYSQKIFRGELDKYIIMAKACQQRGFENELTRTARKQKEQTS